MAGRLADDGRFGTRERQCAEFRGLVAEVQGLAMRALMSCGPASRTGALPIVLVHGLGLSHRYMMPVAKALAGAGYRVYVPDLPGFGDSGHPDRVLDIPGLADALAAWMVAVGVDRAALLGNSQGCQTIADFAARHPARVECAVLQGPTTPSGERSWLQQFIRGGRMRPIILPNSIRSPTPNTGAAATTASGRHSATRSGTASRTSCRTSQRRYWWCAASSTRSAAPIGRPR
jgi:pimeloyl-ACP methyl ester carboxylesterase